MDKNNTESVETEDKKCVITSLRKPHHERNILRCGVSEIDRLIKKHTENQEYEMVSILNKRKDDLNQIQKPEKEKALVLN